MSTRLTYIYRNENQVMNRSVFEIALNNQNKYQIGTQYNNYNNINQIIGNERRHTFKQI